MPTAVVEEAMSHTLSSDGVLVIGSSLMVYSGTAPHYWWQHCFSPHNSFPLVAAFRFVRAADATHLPIALLNIGPTRADALASIHLKLELKVLSTRHQPATLSLFCLTPLAGWACAALAGFMLTLLICTVRLCI